MRGQVTFEHFNLTVFIQETGQQMTLYSTAASVPGI
jgi:hypothetical protein